MKFTKTDYIQYLNCPKSLWLLKRYPNRYSFGEFSTFMQKLVREGYEVERYVRQFFGSAGGRDVSYQTEFKTEDGLYARVDALENMSDGTTTLYEVKSSTSVKTDNKHNHIKDACFQKICAERTGQKIDRVFLIHLNGDYVRDGEIDPCAMLVFADITEAVDEIAAETSEEIDTALEYLDGDQKLDGCSCVEKTRGNHCDAFSVLNPSIPTPSIYNLPRISSNKIRELRAIGVIGLNAVPKSISLSRSQHLVVDSFQDGEPKIDEVAIKRFFSDLSFPLYFFDYETFSSAVPLLDGTSPHKHFPVQYSLHILEQDGSLKHHEYLEKQPQLPKQLIEHMQSDIGESGSIVSWHASFEKTQNREMAVMFPDKKSFLLDMNERMMDLEDMFRTAYADAKFEGSTSIKKVLPVVCPSINYDDLAVKDGSLAMEAWQRMINAAPDEAGKFACDLLSYCERDTLAMVEIYRVLFKVINQ
ncbi:MAG TPA: DUF2779 domain-containing protein [Gammaproteobacteria bacterium]|nr:DUF2779 domain-containing protein [Gammaproteobacteria bacterium]